MFNRLLVRILVPAVTLMFILGASYYFVALRTMKEFAQEHIEKDLESITHDLFNVVDNGFMEAIKSSRVDDRVALRIRQVDCLDILERNTYARQFKLIVYEKQSGVIRLQSELSDQVTASEVIGHFTSEKKDALYTIADDQFYVRQFYFSPWDWNFLVLKNTRTYAELSQRVHHVYLASGVVLFLGTISLVLFLIHSVKQPISSIVSSVSKGKAPEYRGTYEFEFLSRSIGDMMTSLKNEVAERKRAEKEAESASQAKSEFLANMSHELRTPLNAILGFSQIMERNRTESSDEESIMIIQRSGQHLLTLINQVLDLSKIEAGHVNLEHTCFDLLHLLDELKYMLALKAAKKNLTLTFGIGDEVPRYIRTDEVKLRQVLINLLNNAIKFTHEGFVSLTVSAAMPGGSGTGADTISPPYTACKIDFKIEDTGMGVAPEEMKDLFQAFGQTASGKSVGGGTGLGLVISKKFVELLGGEIILESQKEKGSKFSFSIPVEMARSNEVAGNIMSSRVVGLVSGHPGYRILVVDDKWDNRRLFVRLLQPLGFEVLEAENGHEALAMHEEWKPHLILMDIRMPVMDGLEATRRIRALEADTGQPVIIAVTANVLKNTVEKVLEDGCDDIIIKPFNENDFFEKLRKYLMLEYVYEHEKRKPFEADNPTDMKSLNPEDFKALPEEIIDQLRKSITALKMNTALDVISEIRKENVTLADSLEKLVLEYRFDSLQKILGQPLQSHGIQS